MSLQQLLRDQVLIHGKERDEEELPDTVTEAVTGCSPSMDSPNVQLHTGQFPLRDPETR